MASNQDVQAAVDDLAGVIERSVLIEDRQQQPLWWSTRGAVDGSRFKAILHRSVDAEGRAVVQRFHLRHATEPTRTPPMPEIEMWARWCVPVRHGGEFLGLLWILDPDQELERDSLGPALACADLAGGVLDELRDAGERSQKRHDELVARLLEGSDSVAAQELSNLHHLPPDVRVGVTAPARRGEWPLPDGMSFHAGSRRGQMATSGAPLPLTDLKEAVRRATLTRQVVRAGGRLRPASWDALGAWGLIVEAPQSLDPAWLHPAVTTLTDPAQEHLLAAARAVLDHGGDIGAASDELHIHRTTVYYRLGRVRELTGVDVLDGPSRTNLQPALWLAAFRSAGR